MSQWKKVKEISQSYGVSEWTIYEHIRKTPNFPHINLGKKNYRVHEEKFEEWLISKTKNEKVRQFEGPSIEEILGK